MHESTEERALCVIAQRLHAIRTDDGYCTDAGLSVHREREHLDESECPAVVIWSGDETPADQPAVGEAEIALSVSIELHAVLSRPETGPMLSGMKRDVKRALLGGENSFGGLVFNDGNPKPIAMIGYTGCKVFPRKDGSKTASVTLHFTVTYKEQIGL